MSRTLADDLCAKDPDFRFPLSEVPMPTLDWTTRAACRRPDLKGKELQDYVASFFPSPSEKIPPAIVKLCESCPVFVECYEFSMRWRVLGVWAGRREEQRNKERKLRRRARLRGAA